MGKLYTIRNGILVTSVEYECNGSENHVGDRLYWRFCRSAAQDLKNSNKSVLVFNMEQVESIKSLIGDLKVNVNVNPEDTSTYIITRAELYKRSNKNDVSRNNK